MPGSRGSNTCPILVGRGWHVNLAGNVGNLPKDDALLVWPVRGGE